MRWINILEKKKRKKRKKKKKRKKEKGWINILGYEYSLKRVSYTDGFKKL